MFSNLRQGSQVYVLHKCASTPYLEMGSVDSTSNMMMGYFPSMPISLSVRIGEKVMPYQNLPASAEVADVTNGTTGETVTIACTRDALNAELQSERQKSVDSINSVEYHRQRIAAYDAIIQKLNPEAAEKAAQAQEMADMRQRMLQMSQMIERLSGMLSAGGAENGTYALPAGEAAGTVVKKKGETK